MSAHRVLASPIQRQFWLAQQLAPDCAAYNIASAFLLRGPTDVAALERSLLTLVQRYPVLHSSYDMHDNKLWQVIHPEPRLDVVRHKVGAIEGFQAAAQTRMDAEAGRPFDLATDPVVRYVEIRSDDPALTAVAIIVHHIAIDLATKDMLSHELSALYGQNVAADACVDVAEPTHLYEQFAPHMAEWLGSEKATKSLGYWESQLRERDQRLPLGPDRGEEGVPAHTGSKHCFTFSDQLSHAVAAFSKKQCVAPFVTLLACYYALLHKWTQSNEIIIGVPLSNRQHAESQGVVGCFVNTLPLCMDLVPSDDFDTLLRATRKAMLGAHRHQAVPVERIVHDHGKRHSDGRNPLYQVGFTFEHPMQLALDDVRIETLECSTGCAQLELFLRIWQQGAAFRGHFEFSLATYNAATVQAMLASYETMVRHVVGLPMDEAPVAAERTFTLGEIPWLPPTHADQLRGWNSSARAYPTLPLHDAFEEQANRCPDAVALSYAGETLTYRQFNERANQLAHHLVQHGVNRGDLVGVCMHRGFDMLVGIYAVLKAGAAYVPIEPDYPRKRIATLLEQIGNGPVLLTNDTREAVAPDYPRMLDVNDDATAIAKSSTQNLDVAVSLNDLAYVIYTSGSTGVPKGVMNSHGAIANRLCWMQETFALVNGECVLHKTPFSFDVSVWELFWPLQVGARLEIAAPGEHRDPAALSQLLREAEITTVHFVPSMLEMYLAHRWGEESTTLKRVICSGEALSSGLRDRFFERFKDVELHNLYGPTEAAVDVTHWHCAPGGPDPIPIGRTIANTQMYVLDANGASVPMRAVGEITIGGVQVARGYWNNAALTAERFVADPHGTSSGSTLYGTGDRGRFLANGAIEFLGRIDFQAKIQGNRIEFGEIEHCLRQYPGVKDAVAVITAVPGSNQSLVAYIIGHSVLASEAIRPHVAQQLPDYMVPAHLVILPEFPLTRAGKVDRAALPPVQSKAVNTDAPVTEAQPMSAVQQQLAELWKQTLRLPNVDVHDNFFDLGGTSLLLMEVYSRLRQAHGDDLRIATLFQFPTIARMAAYLESRQASTKNSAPAAGTQAQVSPASAPPASAATSAKARAAKARSSFGRMRNRGK